MSKLLQKSSLSLRKQNEMRHRERKKELKAKLAEEEVAQSAEDKAFTPIFEQYQKALNELKAASLPKGKTKKAVADLNNDKTYLASKAKLEASYHPELQRYMESKQARASRMAELRDSLDAIGSTYRPDLVKKGFILSVERLKQFFSMGGNYKTKAVHDVSFQIKEGECMGLVGESGCGKTTTGRCIIRLYDITSGSIYYKGWRINGGTRWNEKEIKWSRIHAKEKVAALRKKEKEEIHSIPLKSFDLENKLKNLTREEAEELKEKVQPFDEDSDTIANSIKSIYEPRLKEVSALLSAAKIDEKGQAKAICAFYENEISRLKKDEKQHLEEQRELIREIHYDNRHVSSIKIPDEKQPAPNYDEPLKKITVSQHSLTSEVQMIFQDPVDSLDPRMTVEDIIQEGLHIQGQYNKAENHQKCVDMLRKVGLIADYASRYPHEFSGGQRQRIGIARALVMNPRLLICDEPISALDVSIRAQILNLLNDVKSEMGLTLLFIAHDLSVVKYFCDRIAVMYFGNLVEVAPSEELFRHPLHPYTRALLSAIPKPDPLSEKNRIRKVYNPATAHDYSIEKPSLREILPGHFVLCNTPEFLNYKKEIKALDEASLVAPAPKPRAEVKTSKRSESKTKPAMRTKAKTTARTRSAAEKKGASRK